MAFGLLEPLDTLPGLDFVFPTDLLVVLGVLVVRGVVVLGAFDVLGLLVVLGVVEVLGRALAAEGEQSLSPILLRRSQSEGEPTCRPCRPSNAAPTHLHQF